jgi:osmotically-inducible protein OsmY
MNKLNRTFAVLVAAALVGLAGCASKGGSSYFDDAKVTARVKKAIYDEPTLKVTDISVTTEDSVVSLSGAVKTRADRTKAEQVARKVEGVKRVKNELKIGQ